MAGIFVLKMKKSFGFALILILVLCLELCACDATNLFPWGDKVLNDNDGTTKTYKIYVCGAVENEGYYEVKEGGTYFDAIKQAGLLNQSSLPSNHSSLVTDEPLPVVVHYKENDVTHYCINVNHQFFLLRQPIDGISMEVVNKIADYLEAHGTIRNKKVLHAVLGDEDFSNYHYKLYVAETDYEEID